MNIQNLASNAYIQDWLKGKFEGAFAENGANLNGMLHVKLLRPWREPGRPRRLPSSALQKLVVKSDEVLPGWREAAFGAVNHYLDREQCAVWLWLFDKLGDYAAVASERQGLHVSRMRHLRLPRLHQRVPQRRVSSRRRPAAPRPAGHAEDGRQAANVRARITIGSRDRPADRQHAHHTARRRDWPRHPAAAAGQCDHGIARRQRRPADAGAAHGARPLLRSRPATRPSWTTPPCSR